MLEVGTVYEAMTCGRSKEETVEVVELGRTAIKSLEGQGALTNSARSPPLDCLIESFRSDICTLQGVTCKTVVLGCFGLDTV